MQSDRSQDRTPEIFSRDVRLHREVILEDWVLEYFRATK